MRAYAQSSPSWRRASNDSNDSAASSPIGRPPTSYPPSRSKCWSCSSVARRSEPRACPMEFRRLPRPRAGSPTSAASPANPQADHQARSRSDAALNASDMVSRRSSRCGTRRNERNGELLRNEPPPHRLRRIVLAHDKEKQAALRDFAQQSRSPKAMRGRTHGLPQGGTMRKVFRTRLAKLGMLPGMQPLRVLASDPRAIAMLRRAA